MPGGGAFHPMARGERWTLVCLVAASAVCFLPVWRGFEVAGMVLSGWLLAALMVVSPILTLCVVARRAGSRGRSGRDT